MIRSSVTQTVAEIRQALGRVESEEDVRYVLEVAGAVGLELGGDSVEQRLKGAIARCARIAPGRKGH